MGWIFFLKVGRLKEELKRVLTKILDHNPGA